MKINKIIGAIALSLGLGILTPAKPSLAASPLPTKQNYIDDIKLESIENYDLASATEIEAYLNQSSTNLTNNKEAILATNFGNEYKTRLDLAKSIKTLTKINPVNSQELINQSIDILNTDKLDDISKQDLVLKTYIIEKQEKLKDDTNPSDYSLSPSEEIELEKQIKDYLDDGVLIEGGSNDANTKLIQAQQAIINSKSYILADDKLKEVYDEVIEASKQNPTSQKEAYDLLVAFAQADDKLNFEDHKNIASSEIANINFNASNDESLGTSETSETSIENTTQNAEAETSANSSPFLNNDKTNTRYNELTDPLKRELDAIDTDNNGILSDAELDSSANYSSDLDKDSWLYPFTEKGQNESATSTDSQTVANTENTSEQTSTPTEQTPEPQIPDQAANPNENRKIPETVTIDNNATRTPELADTDDDMDLDNQIDQPLDNEWEDDFDNDEWSEAEAASNTEAASIVKTGIKGLGTIIVILLVALLAYLVLTYNKKKK